MTVTVNESDIQPVAVSVNANFAVPVATPVTTPELVTDAIKALLVAHVPPVVGVSVVVAPIHTADVPTIATDGLGLTVTGVVVEVQPVTSCVKVKVTLPCATPVTVLPDTDAIALLLLAHVPPEDGVRVVVAPTQIEYDAALTTGLAVTVTAMVSEHEVVEYIKL